MKIFKFALCTEDENGTPSLEIISGFDVFQRCKIISTIQVISIDELIVLINNLSSNITRFAPKGNTYL